MKFLFLNTTIIVSLLLIYLITFAISKPQRKDWSSLDLDLLEQEWLRGDDLNDYGEPRAMLNSDRVSNDGDDRAMFDTMLRFQNNYHSKVERMKRNKEKLGFSDEYIRHAEGKAENVGKPVLIFARARIFLPDLSNFAMNELCQNWLRDMPFMKCFVLNEGELLLSAIQSWRGYEMYSYLLNQSDFLREIEWDGEITKLS